MVVISQKRNTIVAQLSQTGDALGLGIDKKIFDLIVELNLQNINTVASCEGHIDHGYPYPWVDIECIDADILSDAVAEEYQKMSKRLTKKMSYEDEVTLFATYHKRWKILRDSQAKEREKLMILLKSFYKKRVALYDCQLAPFIMGQDRTRLQSIGTSLVETLPLAQQKIKLKEYQNEMRMFTDFLKSIN